MAAPAGNPSVKARLNGGWMAGLVQAHLAPAGDLHPGHEPPALVADGPGELDALGREVGRRGLDVVAHQVELVMPGLLARMRGDLARRGGEDRPAAARVDLAQLEYVAQEGADRVGVGAEDDRVDAGDHVSAGRPSIELPLCSAA